MSYEASLKQKRDWESVLSTAVRQGRKEERALAEAEKAAEKRADKIESAQKMLSKGFEPAMIADILGLSLEEVEQLK